MNNTSTVAELVRKAGKWAVLGSVITIFSIAASSCLKEDSTAPSGGDDGGAAGSGNDDDSSGGGDAGDSAGDDSTDASASFMDACGEQMGEDVLTKLQECGASNKEAQQLKVNMLIVLDKSGSMNNTPDGYNTSLWESVKSALQAVLEDSKDRINFAMELFPFPSDPDHPINAECTTNCCEMPVASDINVGFDEEIKASTGDSPDDPAYKRMQDALEDTDPGGGTPTAEALRRAREYLQSAHLEGNTYVLLATDGGPNCSEDTECERESCTMHIDGSCATETDPNYNCCATVGSGCLDDVATRQAIEDLADDDVKTYVVGIPGSEPYVEALNAFAVAGEVPNADSDDEDAAKYYRVSVSGGSAELVATFKKITEQLVTSCEIPLAEAPPEPQKVNVAVNCMVLPQTDSEGNAQWEFGNSDTVINILGPDCEEIQANGARRVDVLLGCPKLGIF